MSRRANPNSAFRGARKALTEIRSDYASVKPSRFRRARTGLGGSADAHLTPTELWRLREYCRAMDRDDAIIGQVVDRATDNVIGRGMQLEPETGDEVLDEELKDMWSEWATDPFQCDASARLTFSDMERLSFRHRCVDGDIFALPLEDGRLQMVEADRCGSPRTANRKNLVHGILLDDQGAPTEYWFADRWRRDQKIQRVGDVVKQPARNGDEPNVLHVTHPKRVTQTRGLPVFTPLLDIASMFDDVNFAKVVQQQIVSCFGVFLEREAAIVDAVNRLGSQTSETAADSTTDILEALAPGMVIKGKPGEKLVPFNSNTPNPEWFDHIRLLVRLIAGGLGLPLTIAMLDASNTTFHGYRGEIDQARLGFECIQKAQPAQFNRPAYRWKLRNWIEDGVLGQAAQRNPRLFRHRWIGPGWRYIEPLKDAQADALCQERLFKSPTQIQSERGRDFRQTLRESLRDNEAMLSGAIELSQRLQNKYGVAVPWQQCLTPFQGEKSVPEQFAEQGAEEADEGGKNEPKDARKPATSRARRNGALNGHGRLAHA